MWRELELTGRSTSKCFRRLRNGSWTMTTPRGPEPDGMAGKLTGAEVQLAKYRVAWSFRPGMLEMFRAPP